MITETTKLQKSFDFPVLEKIKLQLYVWLIKKKNADIEASFQYLPNETSSKFLCCYY